MDLHSKMTMYLASTMTSPVAKTTKMFKWLRLDCLWQTTLSALSSSSTNVCPSSLNLSKVCTNNTDTLLHSFFFLGFFGKECIIGALWMVKRHLLGCLFGFCGLFRMSDFQKQQYCYSHVQKYSSETGQDPMN